MNYRKLKKQLKKAEADGRFEAMTVCQVNIKFSDEIAHWDEKGYFQTIKWDIFWDKFNRRKDKKRYGNDNWWVVYGCKKDAENTADGQIWTGIARWLVDYWHNSVVLQPNMTIFVWNQPTKYRSTVDYRIWSLKCAMEECAKFCGGTVEFTYTDMQRLPFERRAYRTLKLGKGISKELK